MDIIRFLFNALEEIIKSLTTTLFVIIPTLIAVYVAIKQYFLSKHQLKVELYEKRYKIYLALKELSKNISTDVTENDFLFQDFKPVLNEAKFLFPVGITDYMQELVNMGEKYRNDEKDWRKSKDPHYTESFDKYNGYFNNQYIYGGIESKFAPFLSLSSLEISLF